MVDLEELYRRFQNGEEGRTVTLENGLLTITFSRGKVRIWQERMEMLIQGRVYDAFDWSEEWDEPEDVEEQVEDFASLLERLGRDNNHTFQTVCREAGRQSNWFFLGMTLLFLAALWMMGRTKQVFWLALLLAFPLLWLIPGTLLRQSAVRKYWVCPRCGEPLPWNKGKLFHRMKYVAACPHCGASLEEIPPVERLWKEESSGEMGPDPEPPQPASPWPARICGGLSLGFTAFIAMEMMVWEKPGYGAGLALGLLLLALCLGGCLPLLVCHPPKLPDGIRPLVAVRENRLVVGLGIVLWLLGLGAFFMAIAVAMAPPLDLGLTAVLGLVGALALGCGVSLLLCRRNRAFYLWKEGSRTRAAYVNCWGHPRFFDWEQVASTLMTVNRSVHLLDQEGNKLAAVETNMPGSGRLMDWLALQNQLPGLTPAMKKVAQTRGDIPPATIAWREEYRTPWHDHMKAIQRGIWAALILMGFGGILPGVLHLNGLISYDGMILLLTLAPLPFFILCFLFSPVLLLGDPPKTATEQWKSLHIRVSFRLLTLWALIYMGQYIFLWERQEFQVAGTWEERLVQTFLAAGLLTLLFVLVTPKRLRRYSGWVMGFFLFVFCWMDVYGVNLLLAGPAHDFPLVVLEGSLPDPEEQYDTYTLTVLLEDGSRTKLYATKDQFETAMSGGDLILSQRESPLGMTFARIGWPWEAAAADMTLADFTKETEEGVYPEGGNLVWLDLDPALAYGRMRALFGEPNYQSDILEMAYTYVLYFQPDPSRKVYLQVYQGSGGPAIGGEYDEESFQAAKALKKLLETSDAVTDYSWEGYYPDLELKIQMGVRNGRPYLYEAPWQAPTDP